VSDAEAAIVRAVERAVGPAPVLLLGSRALGTATATSDWDVLVVLPLRRVPRALRALASASRALEAELGAPVSVNAMPAFRTQSRDNLFVWKLRRESRALAGEPLAPDDRPFALTDRAAFSYLMSALVYLLESDDERAVRKARAHVEQLRALRAGSYAAVVDAGPGDWNAARDSVLAELARVPAAARGSLRRNAQYAALSALRGRERVRAAAGAPVERRLAEAAVHLARARDGDERELAAALAALPAPLRPRERSWQRVRDVVVSEWASAHPLLGL
jgi:predicted nucleotidyltransferase